MKYVLILQLTFWIPFVMNANQLTLDRIEHLHEKEVLGIYKSPSSVLSEFAPAMEYRELDLHESGYKMIVMGDISAPKELCGEWHYKNGILTITNQGDGGKRFIFYRFVNDTDSYVCILPQGVVESGKIERGDFFVKALIRSPQSKADEGPSDGVNGQKSN